MRQDYFLVAALVLLTVLMVYSFLNLPWGTMVDDRNVTSGEAVSTNLFQQWGLTLVVLGLILGVAMVGGVFLSKMEGRP